MRDIVRIFLSFFALVAVLSCATRGSYVTVTGFAQGGTYTVKFNAEGLKESPEQVRDSIDALLRDIDNSLSGYNKKSLLSRFNAGERIVPDPLFQEIYSIAYEVFEQTSGAVDAASAPLFDIWGFGFANDSLPSSEKVREVMLSCGMSRLKKTMLA